MNNQIKPDIIERVKKRKYFYVFIDDISDEAYHQQFTIVFRCVKGMKIEDFLIFTDEPYKGLTSVPSNPAFGKQNRFKVL